MSCFMTESKTEYGFKREKHLMVEMTLGCFYLNHYHSRECSMVIKMKQNGFQYTYLPESEIAKITIHNGIRLTPCPICCINNLNNNGNGNRKSD